MVSSVMTKRPGRQPALWTGDPAAAGCRLPRGRMGHYSSCRLQAARSQCPSQVRRRRGKSVKVTCRFGHFGRFTGECHPPRHARHRCGPWIFLPGLAGARYAANPWQPERPTAESLPTRLPRRAVDGAGGVPDVCGCGGRAARECQPRAATAPGETVSRQRALPGLASALWVPPPVPDCPLPSACSFSSGLERRLELSRSPGGSPDVGAAFV